MIMEKSKVFIAVLQDELREVTALKHAITLEAGRRGNLFGPETTKLLERCNENVQRIVGNLRGLGVPDREPLEYEELKEVKVTELDNTLLSRVEVLQAQLRGTDRRIRDLHEMPPSPEVHEELAYMRARHYELKGRLSAHGVHLGAPDDLFVPRRTKESPKVQEEAKHVFLSMVSTSQLLAELQQREGVRTLTADPHADYEVNTAAEVVQETGPARIYIITD